VSGALIPILAVFGVLALGAGAVLLALRSARLEGEANAARGEASRAAQRALEAMQEARRRAKRRAKIESAPALSGAALRNSWRDRLRASGASGPDLQAGTADVSGDGAGGDSANDRARGDATRGVSRPARSVVQITRAERVPLTPAEFADRCRMLLAVRPELSETSGGRSPAHNAAVGGGSSSKHLTPVAMARDFVADDPPEPNSDEARDLVAAAQRLGLWAEYHARNSGLHLHTQGLAPGPVPIGWRERWAIEPELPQRGA